ncbi:MAG TPA: tetratricopeptide repeat protein [Polyangiaceae bacterium]|nr:tetratricopeptide repeat protein [Polyangiaceae bacterium]
MSSTSRLPTSQVQSPPQDLTLVTSAIARLRAEHDASGENASRAILLHEIGVLEERLGDEAASARDQLGAVNAEPDFREPLERLIAIIERRQSYKNLGKLLERLVRVAERPEERSRALLDQAFYLLDHEDDFGNARSLLEQASDETPRDASVWLALELVAGKLGDSELRERALLARAALTSNPLWKALLLLSLAEQRAAADETEGAERALEEALSLDSPAHFSALCALADLAQKSRQWPLGVQAHARIAQAILDSLSDASRGDALGVPPHRRSAAQAADAWLCAAEMARDAGDTARAIELVERGLQAVPGDPMLLRARFHAADTVGDTATAARLAQTELDRGATGPGAASLLLRVAEARASENDAAGALSAVSRALSEDPTSVAARALHLDLLGMGEDAQAFASALEAAAEQFPTDDAKARLYLLSADVWARQCRDAQGARAALSQAGMFGASPAVVARVARLLASLGEDAVWYEEATRRLIAQGATEAEQAGLWFELTRARSLRGERAAATTALKGLAAAPGGGWLGNALSAYALDLLPGRADDDVARKQAAESAGPALAALAAQETHAATAQALRLMLVLRAVLQGDQEAARKELEELHTSDPANAVVARALSTLEKAHASPERAADVLAATASATDDPELGLALELEAGILSWQAGDRKAAVESFGAASGHARGANALLGWALSAAEPNDLHARRRALEAAAENAPDLAALDRFALEVARGGDSNAARDALTSALEHTGSELHSAALLARALWSPSGSEEDDRARALEQLAENRGSAALARGAAYAIELSRTPNGADATLTDAARNWASADPGLAPALEWLGAAIHSGDVKSEIEARLALARRLPAALGAVFEASAALVSQLSGEGSHAPLDSAEPAAKLTNLELATPGSDPRRRAHALLDVGLNLGEESLGVVTALAGYNQLAYGDTSAALESFRQVVEAHPEELMGWEGLRTAAEAVGDRATLAEACAALGDAVSDASSGSQLWEQAASILLDEFKDRTRGEFALSRAVERDVRRFTAFDRLFRMVRERKDAPRLLELVARRLDVAEDPEEIAKLFWERARVLRSSGDREGALAALENVRMLEPEHVGALALSGEIYITLGRFAEAAENLARLGALDEAPAQQRLMSGIAAVDLYENKLDDAYAALDVLSNLHRSGLSTLPVRERLARAAARAEAWDQATEALELLMNERETSAGRIEAARLAMVIYRDRLKQKGRAQAATSKLLGELPDDGEALDLVLGDAFPKNVATALLERGLGRLTQTLLQNPMDTERVERLSRMASFLGRAPLRQASLGALIALGVSSEAVEQELVRIDQRVAHVPRIAIDDRALPDLADPEDHGPIGDLMRAIATTICEELGPSLAAFGVGKKERVDPRLGLPVRNEIAAWAGALGLGEFELYVGGRDPDAVIGIASEVPALLLGSAVMAPLAPRHRQAVARELFALRRGTTVLRHRESAEIGALVVAACRLGKVELPSPAYAMLSEFQRLLGKAPGRVRRLLPELARAVANSGQDPIAWSRAAISSLDRMAVIASGDVSWVLAANGRERGAQGLSDESAARAKRLLSFVLSPGYLELRDQLGMGVK